MAAKRRPTDDFFPCPHCGADVPAGARFCRQCGASDESGWGEEAWSDVESPGGYSAEDDDFDYDEFVRREFPDQAERPAEMSARAAFLTLVAVLVIVSLLLWSLGLW
ncbi:MAG: zinc ribbon domain-containing protein [Thermoguttaceae bacterium]|jgi:hypothetical protein|nr:zinc ribbon domain-containing protein [Thermoguttaceae bacterium]